MVFFFSFSFFKIEVTSFTPFQSRFAKGSSKMIISQSKARIEEGDYIEKFAYVGKKTDGTPIIIIFDQCICTSGLEVEGKNKEAGVFAGTFECVADISPEADTLPWHILYPTATE